MSLESDTCKYKEYVAVKTFCKNEQNIYNYVKLVADMADELRTGTSPR